MNTNLASACLRHANLEEVVLLQVHAPDYRRHPYRQHQDPPHRIPRAA